MLSKSKSTQLKTGADIKKAVDYRWYFDCLIGGYH